MTVYASAPAAVRNFRTHRSRQSGFTLVEVMVAALIMSVGLLGLAGLQAASLRNNQGAFMRSQASTLVYDLADRMRTNVSSANSNFYSVAAANVAVNANCNTTAGCTPQQMAQSDLAEWNTVIASHLPLGQGIVCVDSSPDDGTSAAAPQCDGLGSQFSIKLWWDDNRDGIINMTATNTERFVISFRL